MGVIWLDGRLVGSEDSPLGLGTHALHYGTAVFDGCRFYRSNDGRIAVFRLVDHLRRFTEGARALFMEIPFSLADLTIGCKQVVRASELSTGYLRPIAFYGEGAMGISARNPVHVAVLVWALAPHPEVPLRLRVAGFGHGAGHLSAFKFSGRYLRSFLARREAESFGADDALFVDQDGIVSEATGANVFIVTNGRLETPSRAQPILAGITRDTILRLAREADIEVSEVGIRYEILLSATEVFLVSTSREIQAIGTIEGRSFPAPGSVTALLSDRYRNVVRGDDRAHEDWLDFVD